VNEFLNLATQNNDSQAACAALVVLAYPSFDVVYEDYEIDRTDYPYIPGFLAFKEIPSLTILFDRLRKNSPGFLPQVLLVDGNGKYPITSLDTC
jgi:deoxyinosine 3'endonuclease (endonuclease V)